MAGKVEGRTGRVGRVTKYNLDAGREREEDDMLREEFKRKRGRMDRKKEEMRERGRKGKGKEGRRGDKEGKEMEES